MSVHTRYAIAALTLAIGALAPAARANIMIDDFTQRIAPLWPEVQSSSTAGGAPSVESGLSSVAGNTRGYVVNSATINVPGLDNITSTVFNSSGLSLFDYQSSIGASGDVQLFYGDVATNPLLLSGVAGISIAFTAYDRVAAGPLEVDVSLIQKTSPSTSVTTIHSILMNTAGAQTIFLPNTSPALTSVDQIKVDFITSPAAAGTDFRIDSISATTPEPASLTLLALAAPLLLKRRR